ncbi:MAG: phosphotransferase [Patescibacteria group bacterium]
MPEIKEDKRSTPQETLTQEGLSDVRELPQQKSDVWLFEAVKDGQPVFVKGSVEVSNGVDRIENQVLAQKLLHTELLEQALKVPDAELVRSNGLSLAIMERVEGSLLGESRPDGLKEKMSEAELETLVDWLVAARRIPAEKLPEQFREIADKVWNQDFYSQRLEQNAKEPLALGLLTDQELQTLQQLWAENYGLLTFQHHDIVPFNLMRDQEQKLWLLDGEFARLGMAGYDSAYFALQSYGLYGDGESAAIMLEKSLSAWEKNFPEDQLESAILAPLAYRIVASLNDAPTKNNQAVRERTIFLKDLILSGDVRKLIAGLRST